MTANSRLCVAQRPPCTSKRRPGVGGQVPRREPHRGRGEASVATRRGWRGVGPVKVRRPSTLARGHWRLFIVASFEGGVLPTPPHP